MGSVLNLSSTFAEVSTGPTRPRPLGIHFQGNCFSLCSQQLEIVLIPACWHACVPRVFTWKPKPVQAQQSCRSHTASPPAVGRNGAQGLGCSGVLGKLCRGQRSPRWRETHLRFLFLRCAKSRIPGVFRSREHFGVQQYVQVSWELPANGEGDGCSGKRGWRSLVPTKRCGREGEAARERQAP